MPNQYIIDYFKKNKDRFSFEVLKEKLIKAGYPNNQIEEAARLAYRVAPEPKNISRTPTFWDFWHKKVYTSGKEKILDFVAGFIFTIILKYIIGGLMSLIGMFGFYYYSFILYFIIFLAIIIYLLVKRKYIAFGIICGIILSFIFPIFALFGFLPFYF